LVQANILPVVGSGDIYDPESAISKLKYSQAAAIMIGRVSRGRPWIFRQCLELLTTGSYNRVTLKERLEAAVAHARHMREISGDNACFRLRTVLMWYTKDLPGAAALRAAICREDIVEKQISMLTKAVQAAEANGFESGQPI
jgi:tRNA-dihydrouridine synthase